MFGFFKNLFGKKEEPQRAAPAAAPAASVAPRPPSPSPAPAAAVPKSRPAPLASIPAGSETIAIPLTSLLKRLPDIILKEVKSPPREGDVLRLPVDYILQQMPQGAIKISFAELRQASPSEIFAESSPSDLTDVSLPLDVIVPLLGAQYLNRRPNQKKWTLTNDISPVFIVPNGVPRSNVEIHGVESEQESASPAAAPGENPTAAPVEARSTLPAAEEKPAKKSVHFTPPAQSKPAAPASKAPAATPAPAESPIRFTPPPAQTGPAVKPAAKPFTGTPIRPASAAPAKPTALPGVGQRPAQMPGTAPAKAASVAPPPKPAAPAVVTDSLRMTPQEPPAAAPTPTPAAVAPGASDSGTIRAAIWALMIAWPEALRKEIAGSSHTQRVVAFPASEIEPGIKAGRVAFPWAQIQSWIEPPLNAGEISYSNPEPLSIPLQVIAPLFMALKKPGLAQKKVQIAESIPDVFSGKQETPAPSAPVAAAAPAVAPMRAAPAAAMPASPAPRPAAQPAHAGPVDIATVFGHPGKTIWTPVELVQNTSRLSGVAGALIAMSDGLQVASDLPSSMNAETLAAFLPQIFARVAHYTNEIQLGEPSFVSFATNKQVWQINKAGNVFLLVVGRPGETLPAEYLNAIATQLERQSKTN